MKTLYKKLLLVFIAFSMCLFASVALTACFGGSEDGDKTVTVTFDAGRGTIFGDRFYETEVDIDSVVAAPSEAPVGEEGFIFLGWNKTGNETDAMWDFTADKVTDDMTLCAVWARGYSVKFDPNGGTFASGDDTYDILTVYDALLTAPEITPPDENRVLKGWYYGYEKWDFSADRVAFEMELTAMWDWTETIKNALMPFEYSELDDGSCKITGIKDKTVTELIIPDVVSTISDEAFKDCTEMVSVVISDSVTSIGRSAFEGCSSLVSVTLPANLNTLSARTFVNCTSLENITLPETLTELGGTSFMGCTALKSIELPAGITEIDSSMFRDCTSLERVKIKGRVTEIHEYAFCGCVMLAEFDMPANVTEIYSYAFKNCKSLTSVTLSSACKSIGWSAFENCDKLASADINCGEIGGGAFRGCKSLTSVTLGSAVKEIESSAFADSGITEIDIPDTVMTLEGSVFANCTSLESAEIGSGITSIPWSTFSGCDALREVIARGVLTEIGEKAFENCVSLISYTIPASVTKVRHDVFDGCVRLVEIYNLSEAALTDAGLQMHCVVHTDIAEKSIIEKVGDLSFCKTKRAYYDSEEHNYLIDYNGNGAYLTLPDDYNGESYRVFDYALSGRKNLKSVTISKGVEKLGENILYGSDNVTTLVVASDNTVYYTASNCVIEKAEDKFVLGCGTSIIPDGVKLIGANVFCGNATIVNPSFVIPSSVVGIERHAFYGCTGLIRTAENNIQYVDKWAVAFVYEGNEMLDLTLDAGTVGIAEYAMQESYGGSQKISSITCNPELKYICEDAFYGCRALTSVSLNDGLVSIGGGAFASCKALKEIVIPDSVKSIGSATFMNCAALTYVKLPAGLTTVKYQMFDGCTELISAVIPNSVSTLEHDVFSGCTKAVAYFEGTAEEWATVKKGSHSAPPVVRYYSETEQSGCWHYAGGKPVMW